MTGEVVWRRFDLLAVAETKLFRACCSSERRKQPLRTVLHRAAVQYSLAWMRQYIG